ncbi:heme-binding domain-containing protein [Flavobacterium okayamense]|uniref:Heme-binding protein n=1 Tax=Flavobacterium okayamense TaxID=2830782 RepID=A0ABM7SCM9_9FLAO|nr:heme-binding domain-containing protein [Flavobacterium okayamense]BCY28518.1 heme-binding protein [Flavobacterium okayamense]
MKKIFKILALAFIVIQFFQIDKTNPPVDENQDFLKIHNPSPELAAKIKASCYDCHSNESSYPWYTNIQPVGWWVKNHIEEGKHHLNFSEFGTYSAKRQSHKMEECYELIEEDEMPLKSYTIAHKDAILDDATKEQLIAYFKEMESKLKE